MQKTVTVEGGWTDDALASDTTSRETYSIDKHTKKLASALAIFIARFGEVARLDSGL